MDQLAQFVSDTIHCSSLRTLRLQVSKIQHAYVWFLTRLIDMHLFHSDKFTWMKSQKNIFLIRQPSPTSSKLLSSLILLQFLHVFFCFCWFSGYESVLYLLFNLVWPRILSHAGNTSISFLQILVCVRWHDSCKCWISCWSGCNAGGSDSGFRCTGIFGI